mgnify:CR=1 FL=1
MFLALLCMFTSCIAIPGYVSSNGDVTPSYSKEIIIEVEKGSISINGISLTIANIKNSIVEIAVIPHTYELTNIKFLKGVMIAALAIITVRLFVIQIIERTICHEKGESLEGIPLRGTAFKLQPWHKFIIYNIVGFKLNGTSILRFHEVLIFILLPLH